MNALWMIATAVVAVALYLWADRRLNGMLSNPHRHLERELERENEHFHEAAEQLADAVEEFLFTDGIDIADMWAAWQRYVDVADA